MDNVLQFKQRPVKGLLKPKDSLKYYCRKCDGEKFYLHEDGGVSCVCGAWIANLTVRMR